MDRGLPERTVFFCVRHSHLNRLFGLFFLMVNQMHNQTNDDAE